MKKFGFFIAPFCIFIFAILMFGCSNYEKLLVNELSNDFSIVDNKYGKKLENAFKQYPGNDDICAIYFYYNALFYQQKDNQFDETINYKIYSQLFLRQINPTYNGAMSNEIHNLGIVLFGSKAEWEKQTKYFNTKYNKLSKENKKQINKMDKEAIRLL